MAPASCLLIILLSAVALSLLWPAGYLATWHHGALALGLPDEAFRAYALASPHGSFPCTGLVFLAMAAAAALLDRRNGNRPDSRRDSYIARTWLDSVMLLGVSWVVTSFALRSFGGPFMTGDSPTYLMQSLRPWESLGSHHPTATSWLLFTGRHLSMPVGASLALVSASQFVLLTCFFRRGCRCEWAVVPAAAIMVIPDFAVTNLSMWSEQLFLFFIFSLLVTVSISPFERRHWLIAIGCFLAMSESRHAAIFLLPGLALAAARAATLGQPFWRFVRTAAISCGLFGVAWLLMNVIRTGKPTAPTVRSFECAQFITAYHTLPLCDFEASKELCAMDPDRQYLRPLQAGESEWIKADRFIFRPDSPLNKLKYTQSQVCELWHHISASLFSNQPLAVIQLILLRMLWQLGPWEFTERGEPSSTPLFAFDAEVKLDEYSLYSNPYVTYCFWFIWAAGVIACLATGRIFSPALIFLVLGAFAHALGIALNNPFRALRYELIPKSMLLLASLFVLIDWLKREQTSD